MFDYAAWLERAQGFVNGIQALPGEVQVWGDIAPALSAREADRLARQLPNGLPSVLRDFLTQGSSRCEYRFWWEPPEPLRVEIEGVLDQTFVDGGPAFFNSSGLVSLEEERLGWVDCFEGNCDARQSDRDLWMRCTAFASIDNGDMLAIDASSHQQDPPVAYLCHDGESSIIASSFSQFLRHWEAMSYIGAEIWLLELWIRADTGYIDSANPKTALLRRLLTQTR